MVTNGKRLFVTELPINYDGSEEQTKESEKILENLSKINNLGVPYELSFYAKDMESSYQNAQSSLSVAEEKLHNIINSGPNKKKRG